MGETRTQTLLVSAGFALITSAIYAFVGIRLARRPMPRTDRFVVYSFSAFWIGLAISTIVGANGIPAALAARGYADLGFTLGLTQIGLLAITVALWGLLYYLVYLYTGRRSSWIPLAVFYVVFFGFLEYFVIDAHPIGLTTTAWAVNVEYQKYGPDTSLANPVIVALIVGLLVPQILASLAYLTLVFRVQSATQRYQILLVSLSIFVWFASPFFALSRNVAQSTQWQLISRFIGLAAAITIFFAYHPPGWIKRRYHIQGLSDEEIELPSQVQASSHQMGGAHRMAQRVPVPD